MRALVAFTKSGEWTISGFLGQPLSKTSVDAHQHSPHGSNWVRPIAAGEAVLWCLEKGNGVRGLLLSPGDQYSSARVQSLSISDRASHFFEGLPIVAAAYAQSPYPLAWFVRGDGKLLSCSLAIGAQDVTAGWAMHPTGQDTTLDGFFIDVCSVPEFAEDAVYVAVQRSTTGGSFATYIERLSSRLITDQPFLGTATSGDLVDIKQACFLDAAKTTQFDAPAGVTLTVGTFAGTAVGSPVNLTTSAAFFLASDVGSRLVVGITTPPQSFNVEITEYIDATHAVGVLRQPPDPTFLNVATSGWHPERRVITGLGHLEGKTVSALVDGAVATFSLPDSSAVVTGGSITLDVPGRFVVAGLSYVSELELLDLAAGEGRTAYKNVSKVTLEVANSRGFLAGEDTAHLYEARPRAVTNGSAIPGLKVGLVEVAIGSTWNQGARVVVRQVDPLPLTIVAAHREVAAGGK
jgi:hypothetical protein